MPLMTSNNRQLYVESLFDMEEALAKIRPHTTSSLAHQKAPATLLRALESTLEEQYAEKTSTAYFAALITILDGSIKKNDTDLGEGDILPAELYLLALIIPFVPPPVIRSNVNTLIFLTTPLFPVLIPHAPPLRSQLTLYGHILQSLDRSQLDAQGVKQSFASILQLCLDSRPKVRRKAADVVKDIISTPPVPLARHPFADRAAEWSLNALKEASSGALSKSKAAGKSSESSAADAAIHLLAFLRPVLFKLPSSKLPPLTTLLLTLPRLGNPYLSQSAYSLLSVLLQCPSSDEPNTVVDQIPEILKAILASPPFKSDAIMSPSWIMALGHAMLALKEVNPDGCAAHLGTVWKTIWTFLESNDIATRKAAAESLSILSSCFPPFLIVSAVEAQGEDRTKSVLGSIISHTWSAFDSLAFARAIPEVLTVVSALITGLRFKPDSKKRVTATEVLLIPIIQKVGDLRLQKGFQHKEAADATLFTAMRILGPEVLLRALPLNLEPSDRQAGREPRAFLLPLLSQNHPSPLGHFVSYFVPMSERMFNLQQTAESDGKQAESKVWSVLVAQIWAGLSGYCHETPDLRDSLSPAFSQLLSQLLYTQPELRPQVLKALKVIVDSNTRLISKKEMGVEKDDHWVNSISPQEVAQNVAFLKGQVESWLAVLFNVFSSVGRDSRGVVGDVIQVWVSIAEDKEVAKAFRKVVELFKQNLSQSQKALVQPHSSDDNTSVTAMTQDLIILLIPSLSLSDASDLFQLSLTPEVLCSKDNGVQKRGYKILARLLETGKTTVDAVAVLSQIDGLAKGLSPAAKKDRFSLLCILIPKLPAEVMHVIPSLIPEAVLGTKEPSEKARLAAFDLIVTMGNKMSEGGVVRRNLLDGMDDDTAEAKASINEYMTMVAGGLAGATPHMISATVTAISRLVFEFKDTLDSNMQTEIFTTLLVFLSSANREIVKSTLGYIKLAIHTLPVALLRPHLVNLVPALLAWSHDHKNHFKAKARHIFERMIRRFGWDDVYAAAGEDQAAKVLVNIKKRKDRAKRRKAHADEDEDDEHAPAGKTATGDAFEDVLYGSESELDESGDEEETSRPAAASKRKGAQHGVRLRVDDDEPMDLLQGAAARLTTAQSGRHRKPGQDAARFKTDEETGKMVIDDGESDSDIEASTRRAAMDVAGTAYRERITSVDGFTRGSNGRVKFNKDTKKRRRENDDIDGDVEMADADGVITNAKKNKRPQDHKLGHEFKAKKAGGDIKKGGVDPYAYLPLSQAAKRKGQGKGRIGITGRR